MRNKSGSALIFVSLLVAFVGIIVMLFARNTTLYYAFTVDRMQYARSQYALQALAQYGIAHCITPQNNSGNPWHTQFQAWPYPDGPYRGVVAITPHNKACMIKAELFKENTALGKVHCEVRTSDNGETIIDGWKYS